MIEIHLYIDNSSTSFLSIPLGDAQRLSIRPLKWIRFVMFAICGARGHLHRTPDDPPVDYNTVNIDGAYYYKPDGQCTFIDHHGLNDRITSSVVTQRRADFRAQVIRRDGDFCIFTEIRADLCDAAHLIGRSKGSEYLKRVIDDRRALYGPTSLSSNPDIDSVENGVLLAEILHTSLGRGEIAILQTPNFALETEDIQRWEQGPMPSTRVTLHPLKALDSFDLPHAYRVIALSHAAGDYVKPLLCYHCGLQVDAVFRREEGEDQRPPAIILDFMYGVAAYNLWKSPAAHDILERYHMHFRGLPIPPRSPLDDDEETFTQDIDDGSDSDYEPGPTRQPRGDTRGGEQLGDAMDEMNLLLTLLHGKTPEGAAREWEKRMEEEEQKSQEAGREKVQKWLQSDLVA